MNYAGSRIRQIRAFAKAKELRHVLQLGSEETEDTLAFAREGFALTVVEPARPALDKLEALLETQGLSAKLVESDYAELPFSPGAFELVLAFNSIYNSTGEGIKANFTELISKLREDGFYYITLISTRHRDYGKGEEVEPGTFRRDGLLYHHTNAQEVVNLLRHTEVIDIRDEEQDEKGSFHWHVLGRKRDLEPKRQKQ